MIAKEADPISSRSRRVQAGAKAEHDTAFFLRRAFGDHRPDVLVFNDLRFEHAGEVAQIDHLVIHRHGMFVIETKHVGGTLEITRGGQFVRGYERGRELGMGSPVEQAKTQARLLRQLLIAHKEELRARWFFGLLQGGFKNCPIEPFVAVSTNAVIRGEEYAKEVRKADQIPGMIEDRVAAHRNSGRLLNTDISSDDGLYRFSDEELAQLHRFLLDRHTPRATAPPKRSAPAKQQAPTFKYLCSKCQSLKLRILHGKYGYYFKCMECSGNTWIDTRINGTDRKGRIRKSGQDFFLVCRETGDERLIFTNPDND